ncbi:MAG: polyhydroxyalkanoic acid synthase [Rhodobacteraceae bacterium]|nr:polyhydroxyalkanoic acid synthase [Paracoccaceae bacterium]
MVKRKHARDSSSPVALVVREDTKDATLPLPDSEGKSLPASTNLEDVTGLHAEPPELQGDDRTPMPDRYSTESLDRAAKAHLARFTQGVTPFGLAATFFDWWIHLASSPGKQVQLAEKAVRKSGQLATYAALAARDRDAVPPIKPLPHDHRFDDESWTRWPWNLIHQNFLLTQQWWYNATNDVDGLSRRDERTVSFVTRQLLDTVSPSNFIFTNPAVLKRTAETGGANLIQGALNVLEDWETEVAGRRPKGAEDFRPGEKVALTPGRVVFRNHLLELIQYAPTTETVQAEPILIVPAWIMKYYILDLSPHNSLVRYLVEQGFTVFAVSWRNPTAEDRDLGMADYLDAVGEALGAINAIVPDVPVQAVGYCLGGTLLAAKAAQMARDGDTRLKSLTLFAAQTDFEDPGELQLFLSESEVAFLEDMMWDQGYLDAKQMAGAFQLLRSRDLIWSRNVSKYLMGEGEEMFDLMAWNADTTRMPYRMHSEYLRKICLDNELAEGRFLVDGAPVAISDIRVPIFCVSTLTDHVAPWHSVYKLHLLADSEVTFLLTTGGHNAGIISEPGHGGREFRIHTQHEAARYLPPEDWLTAAQTREGSWWPALVDWLRVQSGGKGALPAMGAAEAGFPPMEPAPGSYVLQR